MAEQLYFSRDSKLFIEFDGGVWEIPVLDGFSFSQATNASEITLSEMESTAGTSRRGRRLFNDSLAPVEWSFSTYMRPFTHASGYTGQAADGTAGNHHAVEEVLWAMMAGANNYDGTTYDFDRGGNNVTTTDGTDLNVTFAQSNVSVLSTGNLYFVMDTSAANPMVYKITDAAVNEASIDFDVDGIATVNWSGFGKRIFDWTAETTVTGTDLTPGAGNVGYVQIDNDTNPYQFKVVTNASTLTTAIDEGTADTDNFIRNRLTQLAITSSAAEQTAGFDASYSLTLTGGNITITNNITYLVPEEIGTVNVPIENVTGARTVTGNFTCYLVLNDSSNAGTSSNFFEDHTATGALANVNNSFGLTFKIGGASSAPRVEVEMPTCHIEIPTHSIEDVISLETTFHGLGTNLGTADEVTLKYFGP